MAICTICNKNDDVSKEYAGRFPEGYICIPCTVKNLKIEEE